MNTNNTIADTIHRKMNSPWEYQNKIVIGVDIGIKQSCVTFAYLVQGSEMSIHFVMQWPGQENRQPQAEIPTIVWYDTNHKPVSFGVEAQLPDTEENAEDNQWQLAKHFSLHLYPQDLRVRLGLGFLDPLPYNVPLSQIYADFLSYLLRHTQQFFEERILDGPNIWRTYKPTMDLVITHPNGWGTYERAFLRTATIDAGFPSEEAFHRIHFVTKAEASVFALTSYVGFGSLIKPGINFALCDAGESIVETTVYTIKQTQPTIQFEEKCDSAGVQAGFIFVQESVKSYLEKVLVTAGIPECDVEEYARNGAKDFENVIIPVFRDNSEERRINVGLRLNIPTLRIRRGQMTLPGSTIETFFAPCVDEIISHVNSQLVSAAVAVSHIILTGEFGESPYIRKRFNEQFSSSTCQVIVGTDTGPSHKAVAYSALIWYCASSMVCHAPRYSFGVEIVVPPTCDFNGRPVIPCPSGPHVAGGWSQIVTKGIPGEFNSTSRRPYRCEYRTSDPDLTSINQEIYCYSLSDSPKWTRDKSGALNSGFRKVGSIVLDANDLRGALKREVGPRGVPYWTLSFSVCFRFARTDLEAFIEWDENGVTRTSSASIVVRDTLLTFSSPNPQFCGTRQKFDEGLIVDSCTQESSQLVRSLPDQGDNQGMPQQATGDNAETKNLRNQLEQMRSENASLRAQLQIEENVKKGLIKQQLRSMNRQIEDLGRAVSVYLTSKHSKSSDTSLNAHNLDGLKNMFAHTSGRSSLVMSSSGEGMPAADFFEHAVRSILCRQLYLRIYEPFHPTIPNSSKVGSFALDIYKNMQSHESQIVAGKWRKDAFNSINRSIGSTRTNAIKREISESIVSGDLSLLLDCFFGPFSGVVLEQQHILSLQELVSAAWSWNEKLKGSVVLPGDFMPFAHRYGDAFYPSRMINFEGELGKNPQYILSTIGLGVIFTCANADKPETSTLYPALVTSEELFD